MANELHTMPLKVERLFSSRRFRQMRWDERGAYLLLLAEAWLEGGRLPNDPDGIRRLLGVSEDDSWSRIKRFVLEGCFSPSEDGCWLVNENQAEIYTEVLKKRASNSERGRRGAEARWKGEKSSSNAKAMLEQCGSNGNQNQSQRKENTPNGVQKKDAPPSARRSTFKKPRVEEVREYCESRGNAVDAQRSFDFYEAKGWRIGNQPMKDWKAAVRTWERRENGSAVVAGGGAAVSGQRAAIGREGYAEGF